MSTRPVVLALAAAFAMLAGCASDLSVGTTYDPLMRFPLEATWRWDERRNLLPKDERIAALNVGPALREAVSAELAAHGYREAGSEPPDFLLAYQLDVTSRQRPEGSFAIGSLSLQLIEPKSGRHLWMSFAQTEIHIARSDAERRETLRRHVAQILSEFPPGQGG